MTAVPYCRGPVLIGKSRAMLEMMTLVQKIAPSKLNVLILGESGTGKELVARMLHDRSDRASRPFVPVNCAALPENLVESELFGHEKGAFTGALYQRIGKFERAHGGTIFLDEIGEMSMAGQAKSLRALEEREIERIGGNRPIKVDVRVISATNRDLTEAIQCGSFRVDLLFRIQGMAIRIPPLRERKSDIPLLVDHFIKKHGRDEFRRARGISKDAMDVLMDYPFPGNVRELENIIQAAVVLAEGELIGEEDLPRCLLESSDRSLPASESRVDGGKLLDALRRAVIRPNDNPKRLWHTTLRSNTLEIIHRFLVSTNGNDFSRQDFANYLFQRSQSARNKYGTVGRYLQVLKANYILAHNEHKANKTRYRIGEKYAPAARGNADASFEYGSCAVAGGM